MEKVAVIDMGSNSIRLLLAELKSGKLLQAEKQLRMTRLGSGVAQTGRLQADNMNATLEAIREFKAVSDGYGAKTLGAFATSAVREAENGVEFAARVQRETGVTVEIISGEEEAELGFKGVLAGLKRPARVLVIDIGGGSVELILGDSNGIDQKISLPLGAVRMTEGWLPQDPPELLEMDLMRVEIRSQLAGFRGAVKDFGPDIAVGIGGTATALGAIALEMDRYDRGRIQGYRMDLAALGSILNRLCGMSLDARRQVPGLQPKRADIIIAGALVLETILDTFNLGAYEVSDFDNLEGLLAAKGYLQV